MDAKALVIAPENHVKRAHEDSSQRKGTPVDIIQTKTKPSIDPSF